MFVPLLLFGVLFSIWFLVSLFFCNKCGVFSCIGKGCKKIAVIALTVIQASIVIFVFSYMWLRVFGTGLHIFQRQAVDMELLS